MPARRFPPPSVKDIGAAFVVTDSGGQKLAYVYYEEEPGRRSAAKMLTRDEARLPNRELPLQPRPSKSSSILTF